MNIRRITMEEAKKLIDNYDFVLGNTISSMVVGPVSAASQLDWDEIIDLRFFSESKELHIFLDGGLKAVAFEEDPEDDHNDRLAEIDTKVPGCSEYKHIKTREYYGYDNDGQAEVIYTKPVELK